MAERTGPGPLQRRESRAAYLFIAPWILGFLVFTAGPMVASLWLSFTDYSLVEPAHAVGTAIFGLCFVFMLGYLVSRRSVAPRLLSLALGVLALVGAQIVIGAVQYHSHLPWWLVLIHIATAVSVWAGVVALAALFQRPLASLIRT